MQTLAILLGMASAQEGFTCSDGAGEFTEQTVSGPTTPDECLTEGKKLITAEQDGCLVALSGATTSCKLYIIATGGNKDIRRQQGAVGGTTYSAWKFIAGQIEDASAEDAPDAEASKDAVKMTAASLLAAATAILIA